MKITVRKLFEKDISRISDKKLAIRLSNTIEQMEKADSLSGLPNIKKMAARGNYYRMRLGDYRLGFKTEAGTIILLRFMHRKDIYDYFP